MIHLSRRCRLALCCSLAFAGLISLAAVPVRAAAEPHSFKIAAGSAADTLREFGRQAKLQTLFNHRLVKDLRTQPVAGLLEPEEALAQMLLGTGLTFERVDPRTVAIRASGSDGRSNHTSGVSSNPLRLAAAEGDYPRADAAGAQSPTVGDDGRRIELEEILVTGSHIRGAESASPVVTITQDDIRRQGQTDLGQVVRSLPQSSGGGQNPGVAFGADAGGVTNQNFTGASSINLRGLGADATLTLLNGTRLPYDGYFQATDVSAIPVAAIDRLEILLDGASAIYGSDAVGGVANIILKRDYEGAEFSARYGQATSGGFVQQQYTGVGGTKWDSGGFMVAADYTDATGVRAGQRDYLAHLPENFSIYPPSTGKGGLFSGHQTLASFAELSLDAFYTKRDSSDLLNLAPFFGVDFRSSRDSTIWGIAPAVRFDVGADWSLRLHGAVGRNKGVLAQSAYLPTGEQISDDEACYCNSGRSAGVEAEGPIFGLGGGEARLAIGGGYRQNKLDLVDLIAHQTTLRGDDRSHYAYGEINLPFVSEDQKVPLVTRLAVTGAVRYENYRSFGETTTPKFGIIWGPIRDLDVKASWGRSFKVPTLGQQFQRTGIVLYPPAQLGGTGYAEGSGVLALNGGNSDLGPEKAETITAGFVVHPEFWPGLNVELSWFDIDFRDRVASPFVPFGTALTNPAALNLVAFDPTVAQQNAAFDLAGVSVGTFTQPAAPSLLPYDPANIVALIDNRYQNVAIQQVSGIDLTTRYEARLFNGDFTASIAASWFDSAQMITALAPEQGTSGVVFFPAEFKGRLGAAWARNGLTVSGYVNWIGGVRNTLVTPNEKGDSMTTVDLAVAYVVEGALWNKQIEFDLAVTNLFNEEPPNMDPGFPFYVNYDSTNYSALGRVLNATAVVRF